MIRGESLKPRAKSVQRAIFATAVAALGGLTITVATVAAPALAVQPPGWAHVTTGGAHTRGIRTDGTLWCWGCNGYGQLGIGNSTYQDLPHRVTVPLPPN